MCNQYRTDVANAALSEGFETWREIGNRERWSEHGRNMPRPIQSFPNRPGRIVHLHENHLTVTDAIWGMPRPADTLFTATGKPMAHNPGSTNIRKYWIPHWEQWHAVEYRCLVPFTAFAEPNEVTKEITWFRFADGRPFGFFAGVHQFLERKMFAKDPGPTTDEFYAFLTTSPNAEVGAVHPKAMPVILDTPEACKAWLTEPWEKIKKLIKALPDGTLTIAGTGKDWRPPDAEV